MELQLGKLFPQLPSDRSLSNPIS